MLFLFFLYIFYDRFIPIHYTYSFGVVGPIEFVNNFGRNNPSHRVIEHTVININHPHRKRL